MNQRRIYGALAIVTGAASAFLSMETQAAVGYDMRERVIELSGITDTYSTGAVSYTHLDVYKRQDLWTGNDDYGTARSNEIYSRKVETE